MRLIARTGGYVEIPPYVFHDLLEHPRVEGWHIRQEEEDRLTVSVLGPLTDSDRVALAEAIIAELKRRGTDRPIVGVEIVSELPQRALGKMPLITALK